MHRTALTWITPSVMSRCSPNGGIARIRLPMTIHHRNTTYKS